MKDQHLLTVGQEIAYGNYRMTRPDFCHVKTITKGGQVVLENGLRFNKDGKQIGLGTKPSKYTTLWLADPTVIRNAMQAGQHKNLIHSKVVDIKKYLEGRQNGFGRYDIDEESKKRLMELVASIPTGEMTTNPPAAK